MAEDRAHYDHHERKSDEPSETEATDGGLFDFVGKKEEENKCEGEAVAAEFDEKVKVSDEKNHHSGLLRNLHRSTISSSSSSDEEVEEGGEKKKKKKEKKGLKEKISGTEKPAEETHEKKGFLDKIKEKLPGGKKAEDVATPPPATDCATSPGAEGKEKRGFMDKIKAKIPGYSKTEKEDACH